MITEERIKQVFNKQINGLILFLLITEFLFYAQHLYFKDTFSLEAQFFSYLVFHVCIAIAAMYYFMRKALVDILVTGQESKNEKN